MRPPRRPLTAALGLAVVVLLAACDSGAGGGAPVAAPPAAGASSDLSGVCPDPVVVQTNWFPQSEHGAAYQLLGPGYQVDAGRRHATGPLVAPDGKPTGVRIQVRAGGPAVSFQSSAALMYQDPAITLGMLQADEVIQLSKSQPVVGVVAPLELDPQILLWDPQRHPDWNIIADIGQTTAKVLYFHANTYMEYLIGRAVERKQGHHGHRFRQRTCGD